MSKIIKGLVGSVTQSLSARNRVPQVSITVSGDDWKSPKVAAFLLPLPNDDLGAFEKEVQKALNREVLMAVRNQEVSNQSEIDSSLGTLNLVAEKFGAGLTLALSLSAARAAAGSEAFFLYLRKLLSETNPKSVILPNVNFAIASIDTNDNPNCSIEEIMIKPVSDKQAYFEDSFAVREILSGLEVVADPRGSSRGFDSDKPLALNPKDDLEALNTILEALIAVGQSIHNIHFSISIKNGVLPDELKMKLHSWKSHFPITEVHFSKDSASLSDWKMFTQTLKPGLIAVCRDYSYHDLSELKSELNVKPASRALIPTSGFKTLSELLEVASLLNSSGVEPILSDSGLPSTEGELLVDLAVALDCDSVKVSDTSSPVFAQIGWINGHAAQQGLSTQRMLKEQ